MSYAPREADVSGRVFNFFTSLGDIAFAYCGHNVVLEIQSTIPSTPGNPSKKPMWKGVIFAYIFVAICYFPVAFIGYYVFGSSVDDNILLTLEKPAWLIASANMFVFVHVIGGYQVSSLIIILFQYFLHVPFLQVSDDIYVVGCVDICNARV